MEMWRLDPAVRGGNHRYVRRKNISLPRAASVVVFLSYSCQDGLGHRCKNLQIKIKKVKT